MSKTATIQTRITPELKQKAQAIFNKLNLSMSEAISLYLTQVTLHRGIPFEIRIPNELTLKTLKNIEEGKNLKEVSSVDDLFEELNSWKSNIPRNSRKTIKKFRNKTNTSRNYR